MIPAARIATPVTTASRISVRVFTSPSSPRPSSAAESAAVLPNRPEPAAMLDRPAAADRTRTRTQSVRDRTGKLIEKAREAVPEGTFAVGAGLVVAALTTYVFLIVANAGLDKTQYAAFGPLTFAYPSSVTLRVPVTPPTGGPHAWTR